MKIRFFPSAEAELQDAVNYFNSQCEGLGFEFAAEIQRTIERIISNPEAWTKLSVYCHRCRTKRFPHAVIYYIENNLLFVVSIMHMKREPNSWRTYLPPHKQ
ncbi:type II toxin-antitoxin system RelE/ParE family toxin [Geotalea uraniireducens]|nr:type II toxin-antitoxin system RelE/ParE family toxin [Geotalea uraniireducens]